MIVFYLNTELSLFKVSSDFKVSLLGTFFKGSFLSNQENLLRSIWQENYTLFQSTKEIYFLIAPNAGFSRTRLIYIWLINWQNINNLKQNKVSFYIQKIDNDLDLTNLNTFILKDLFSKKNTDLEYSKEPRIN
jgi:hypothetical protein